MNITLRPAEAELLRNILSTYLSDLRMEISNTEQYELRESLKQDEAVIKSLITRLERRERAA